MFQINFRYNWKFGLRHIIPALLNLGLKEKTIEIPKFLEGKNYNYDIKDYIPPFLRCRNDDRTPIYEDSDSEKDEGKLEENFQEIKLSCVDSGDEHDEDTHSGQVQNVPSGKYTITYVKFGFALVIKCLESTHSIQFTL